MKSAYEQLAEEFDKLCFNYMERCSNLPPGGTPMIWNGLPTTVELHGEWAKYREDLLNCFDKHGWTEEEFEEEMCRRIDNDSGRD